MKLREIASWFRPQNRLSMSDPAYRLRFLPVYDAGMTLTDDEALKVSAVWGCIDVITRAIAPAPWLVYEVQGRRRDLRPDDPLSYLLNTRPNPSTTAIAFRESLSWSCMGSGGNGYAEIQKDLAGRPVALWPLEPYRVRPESDGQGGIFYRVSQFSGGTVDVEQSRILHIRGPSVSGFVGDNILYRASTSIAIARAAQQFAAAYFANGTISSGALKHPKALKADSIKRLRHEWKEMHSGMGVAHAPMFLEEGMEWENLSADPEKTQLTQTREFSVPEIARYFGVPLHKLLVAQSAQGYGTNVSTLDTVFVSDTLVPWCERYEQEADFKLIAQRAPWRATKIDLSHLTMGDYKARMDGHAIAKKAGIRNQNEIREAEGWNTVGPEGDVYTVESTMQTVERMLNPPAPPPKMLPAPKPAEPAPAPDEEGAALNATARAAVEIVLAQALDRYGRALKNRRTDLERTAPEKAEERILQAREQLRARLSEDCADGFALLREAGMRGTSPVALYAQAVEDGEPPKLAAARLVDALASASASCRRMEAA